VVRVRKVLLTANERAKARSRSKSRDQQTVG
jgi:GTP-binding protein